MHDKSLSQELDLSLRTDVRNNDGKWGWWYSPELYRAEVRSTSKEVTSSGHVIPGMTSIRLLFTRNPVDATKGNSPRRSPFAQTLHIWGPANVKTDLDLDSSNVLHSSNIDYRNMSSEIYPGYARYSSEGKMSLSTN